MTQAGRSPKHSAGRKISAAAGVIFLHGRPGAQGQTVGLRAEGLLRLAAGGAPVPAGFVLAARLCERWKRDEPRPGRMELLERAVARLSPQRLLAVRSSPARALRGLLPAILNIGMNDVRYAQWRAAGQERLAAECYARLLVSYAIEVAKLPREPFDAAVQRVASPEELPELVTQLQSLYVELAGEGFPQEPLVQLDGAVAAAVKALGGVQSGEDAGAGLPVIVQEMVLGNGEGASGCGWAYTRDPVSGEVGLRGEFLPQGQGPDLISANLGEASLGALREQEPAAWEQLQRAAEQLERAAGDAQDFEFVLERGQAWVLRSRSLRRGDTAAIRIAVEMASGPRPVLKPYEVSARVESRTIDALLHPRIVEQSTPPLAVGLPASPGAASGRIAFASHEAMERAGRGERVVLVRRETQAEDVTAMSRCAAILTTTGGMTSHAAVVARGMGVPCVVGAGGVEIDDVTRELRVGERVLVAADTLTLDGSTGRVFEGEVPITPGALSTQAETLLSWADGQRRMQVYANADQPPDAATAREMGAQGIGLCRTEHMFFSAERLLIIRKAILSLDDESPVGREAVEHIVVPQRQDFSGLFEAMDGLPVTIRLLDPPLHEFLPRSQGDIARLARELDLEPVELDVRIARLHEANPMLGERGCRLSLMRPELLDAQVTAFIEAAISTTHWGRRVEPKLMFPMVMDEIELAWLIERTHATARNVQWRLGEKIGYELGAMIETPRAALRAAKLAPLVSFFSFGTNDLTQLTCGISRDDSQSFIPAYLEQGILPADPFAVLDEPGVGALMEHAVREGRRANPKLKIGICGEHAGDERSIAFCERLGIDYISCSPYRVPAARLAAAQASKRRGR